MKALSHTHEQGEWVLHREICNAYTILYFWLNFTMVISNMTLSTMNIRCINQRKQMYGIDGMEDLCYVAKVSHSFQFNTSGME